MWCFSNAGYGVCLFWYPTFAGPIVLHQCHDSHPGLPLSEASLNKVRVDKWLWAAPMYKTRSMASDACTGGHVQRNGEPAKPSVKVQVGDMVDARTPGGMRHSRCSGQASMLPDPRCSPAAESMAQY